MMLIKDQFIQVSFKYDPVFSPGSVRPFHPVLECFNRVIASFQYYKFFFVHLQNKAFRFLVERKNASNQYRANHQQLFHFLSLLLGFVLFLNVDTFPACSAADCNLYESSYYQGCSPTSGNNQYQCGGGSGSCSDVCGGCGFRVRTSGYFQQNRAILDSLCWVKINASGLSCSRYGSKCTGLRPLRGTFIGLCGVGYESDFDVETICACNDRSSSSSAPSSSSSAPSSSSAQTCPENPVQYCYVNPNQSSCPGDLADRVASRCLSLGFTCGFSLDLQPDDAACIFGYVLHVPASGSNSYVYLGCLKCTSSAAQSSSSFAPSSDSGSSSDSGEGGGGSGGGESSSGSGGGGSGGDGGLIPCGWGDYPPCIVEPIEPEFCVKNPDICYEIGGIDDTLSRYGSAIVDSLGRLIGRLDSLDLGGSGSCLDSANCQPADWGGDSIPYAPGDSAAGSGGSGSGSGAAYSWLRQILAAASIPAASRSCPALPKVEFELGGESHSLDLDICKSEFNLAGHHPLELFGLILRAVSAIAAVVIVLGSVTSLNAGFSKMRRLGG